MDNLEPITRNEMFLNGDDLEPITREEMILAGADLEPITRHEWFLKKYRGGGDVTIKRLTVTENGTYSESGKAYSPVVVEVPVPTLTTLEVDENGTYTAPSGTAYNEVEVNVPLPENTYLLKSVANLPQAIASFNDGEDMVMPTLKVAIEPQQEGSGDPSPTNVRPISGWTEEVITVTDDLQNPTVTHTTTIPFVDGQGQSVEVFGGSVDVINGTSKNEKTLGEITLNGSENYTINSEGTDKISFRHWESTANANADGFQISNRLIYNRKAWRESAPDFSFVVGTNELFLTIPKTTASTVEELKTWIASNNIQIVYELATPTTFYTKPTSIKSLDGENNVSASTGQIEDLEFFTKEA